jgi:nucleotidyltransferase/DNA polymerase involved in DNA repair
MKVSDKVLYTTGSGWNRMCSIQTIERETKTQWIVGGKNFYKKNLERVGNWREKIRELTPETEAEFKQWSDERLHKKLWRDIQSIAQPNHLSASRLQEIYAELRGEK